MCRATVLEICIEVTDTPTNHTCFGKAAERSKETTDRTICVQFLRENNDNFI